MGVRLLTASVAAVGLSATGLAVVPAIAGSATGPVVAARGSAPVVLTGAQIPSWSRSAAVGVGDQTYPSGTQNPAPQPFPRGDHRRTAHNGEIVVPADTRTGVDPDQVSAFTWDGGQWVEVPVQVDQRFPYFLANGRSSFSVYSGTDQELTYAWNPDAHSVGEEAWKKMFGRCAARYATDAGEAQQSALVTPGPQESYADYTHAMQDPVPTLDDDDEIAFMARDAGEQAPSGTPAPTGARDGQTVTVLDPLNGSKHYVYLFLRPGGSSFTASNGYVQMQRDDHADQWVDKGSFPTGSPEALGLSNTSYGPNLPGSVCTTNADGTVSTRQSSDRFPRDAMTVSTPTYQLRASGRWMVRELHVVQPDPNPSRGNDGKGHHAYGPDIIDRWKGRAFQQSPDSNVSVVGFEDEQVNWEANSALLGWRSGPVRAIREVWGADSGTNVTKTETYYRDADVYGYHLRVHPIPPDGLYTDWDYNPGVATTYYNLEKPNGVAIDGVNDDVGNVDSAPLAGPAYFDFPDPTFDVPSAVGRPEEVAGRGFGLVYTFQLTNPVTSATNPAVVPYYRDDACLDDGTGDAPIARPWPGEASTEQRVKDGYVSEWQQYWDSHPGVQGYPRPASYADLTCNPAADPATTPPWQRTPFQGAFAQHGIHFLFTHDSDNATLPVPVDEVAGQQWRFEVSMNQPTNVMLPYSLNVSAPLQTAVTPYQ